MTWIVSSKHYAQLPRIQKFKLFRPMKNFVSLNFGVNIERKKRKRNEVIVYEYFEVYGQLPIEAQQLSLSLAANPNLDC